MYCYIYQRPPRFSYSVYLSLRIKCMHLFCQYTKPLKVESRIQNAVLPTWMEMLSLKKFYFLRLKIQHTLQSDCKILAQPTLESNSQWEVNGAPHSYEMYSNTTKEQWDFTVLNISGIRQKIKNMIKKIFCWLTKDKKIFH